MKKITALILSLILSVCVIAGCSGQSSESSSQSQEQPETAPVEWPEVIRVSALKGPTAMGMVKLMQDAEDGLTANVYDFTIATTDEIIPLIGKGELDIAAVPANLASVLYNNTDGKLQVLAINTLGVLYVVEKGDSIGSVSDLSGKTIYAIGKGAVPEYALNYVLSQNGINPESGLTIEYKSEAAEIIPFLLQKDDGIALIQQPFVTTALEKVDGLRVALDLTKEWDSVSDEGGSLVTGVVVVNREFAEKYPDAVRVFMEEYAASAKYTGTNLSEAAELVGKYGIVDAAIAEKAIPDCNITFIEGDAMREKLEGYLSVLYEQNPQSVGGKLPDEAFYYLP